ncbi:MAG: hypothetical protein JXB88_00435 [Spirochaetales bacterium]|nr:hypothetical protein [Spirochaetales bacterium]
MKYKFLFQADDMAYEWMYGTTPVESGLVNQGLSKQLIAYYRKYQSSLDLQGKNGFRIITANNYDRYILQYYLIPPANKFLKELSDEKRERYLKNNKWIKWTDG